MVAAVADIKSLVEVYCKLGMLLIKVKVVTVILCGSSEGFVLAYVSFCGQVRSLNGNAKLTVLLCSVWVVDPCTANAVVMHLFGFGN